MKFKIRHYEYILPDNKDVTPLERVKLVDEILNTKLDFDGEMMTTKDYLRSTMSIPNSDSPFALNNFAYYITVHHRTEEELILEREDRKTTYDNLNKRKTSTNGILSKNEVREMERGFYVTKDKDKKNTLKKRYDVFSNLDITEKNYLGLDQFKDNEDRKIPNSD